MDHLDISIRICDGGFLAYIVTPTDLVPEHVDITPTSADVVFTMLECKNDRR